MRYDASTPREYTKDGEKKTSWTRIGVGFSTEGGGIMVTLDALPVNGKLFIKEHEEKQSVVASRRAADAPAEDRIPF